MCDLAQGCGEYYTCMYMCAACMVHVHVCCMHGTCTCVLHACVHGTCTCVLHACVHGTCTCVLHACVHGSLSRARERGRFLWSGTIDWKVISYHHF